ncbi:putative transposase [Actinoplanes octamycinicus]|uniref:Putative transposase n=1 Tax=Actinoplanes octamycinicus TaxID=135948 RepID=A0A7W7MBG4_9ACTN|nr:Mu transposase C-terminal domain-containing protein [Actinoplanes octamycinicus]MBB4744001.1 putative transposase [Actinoplanes octamycinicus]
MAGARVDPEQRAAVVARLTALRQAGSLTTAHVRTAASGLRVGERTVWRWLGTTGPGRTGPARYELTPTDREAFAYFRGNIAALARARAAVRSGLGQVAGTPVPDFLATGWANAPAVTLRTLQRAFERQLTPAELAAWRTGEQGRRAASVYLTRPVTGRNVVWELDHKQLPILVLPPRGPAVCPWLTSVIDDGTRALVGWAIALTPHTGTVLTALRTALLVDEQRGPFGAVPAMVRVDRGLEFAAAAVKDALAALCVHVHQLPAYHAHRKGKIERIHQSMEQTLLTGLPGYTKGPRDASGRLHGPLSDAARDRAAAETTGLAPMRIERFVTHRFAPWVTWYNTQRPHSALAGRTPAQAWTDDATAVQRLDAAQLRHLLLAGVERTINKDGIRFNGLAYVAPELHGRRGQSVHVRFMPHDDRFIEVYLDGQHLCTAHPQGQLSPEQVEAFRSHARDESRRLGAARRRASARTRAELAPMTDDEPDAAESRLVPAAGARDLLGRANDDMLRRRAKTNLLGLIDPTASQKSTR